MYTVVNLWNKLIDASIQPPEFMRHFGARAFALILIPVVVYILAFYVHFQVLPNSGSGDVRLSSRWQTHLNGTEFEMSPLGENNHPFFLLKLKS